MFSRAAPESLDPAGLLEVLKQRRHVRERLLVAHLELLRQQVRHLLRGADLLDVSQMNAPVSEETISPLNLDAVSPVGMNMNCPMISRTI